MQHPKITRIFSMPNKYTFQMKPVIELLNRYCLEGLIIVDPFANNSKYGTITNDLNPEMETDYHLPYEDFLKSIKEADIILLDCPYSPRQISECYKGIGLKANMKDTQGFYSLTWKHILRINPKTVIQFGWHTNGQKKHYDLIELLIVNHGGHHNDTLVSVWRKRHRLMNEFFDEE